MARADLTIEIDTNKLDEFVKVDCSNIKCRFLNLSNHTCTLKRISINKNGMCANFEEINKEVSEAFHKRLSGE